VNLPKETSTKTSKDGGGQKHRYRVREHSRIGKRIGPHQEVAKDLGRKAEWLCKRRARPHLLAERKSLRKLKSQPAPKKDRIDPPTGNQMSVQGDIEVMTSARLLSVLSSQYCADASSRNQDRFCRAPVKNAL